MKKLLYLFLLCTPLISYSQAFKWGGARTVRLGNPSPPGGGGGGIERDNLILDEGFDGADPWPSAVFEFGQDNLGEDHGGGTNTWARVQLTDSPNEGDGYHKIEVRSGCDGCQSSGYRSELTFDASMSNNNTEYWYGMSIRLVTPNDGELWTGNSSGHFIQWHPSNGSGSATLGMFNNYPDEGDGWTLGVNPAGGGGASYGHIASNLAITANVWHHVVLHVFWGTNNDGYVQGWIDGVKYWDITGLDFNTDGQYMKLGMNRWGSAACSECGGSAPNNTWVIHYDNLRIGNGDATYNDVAPTAAQTIPEP